MAVEAGSRADAASRPTTFIVVLVVGSVLLSVLVGYLGGAGLLAGGFPQERSGPSAPTGPSVPNPRSCEGSNGSANHSFSIVAGIPGVNNGYNFNGSVPGPCLWVGSGSRVTVRFSVDPASSSPHSWVLIPAGGSTTGLPVFPGAGFANASRQSGIAPGASATFVFHATQPGNYWYICEVPGHEQQGMYGWFLVR